MTAITPEPDDLRWAADTLLMADSDRQRLRAAADEIEALRAVVAVIFEDDDGTLLAEVGSASVLFPFTDEQNAAIRRALRNGSDREVQS